MLRRLTPLLLFFGLVLTSCLPPGSEPVVPEPSASASTIGVSDSTAALGAPFTVSVQLRDADGDPLRQAGHKVTFVTSGGDLAPAAVDPDSTSQTVDTDEGGVAAVVFTPATPGTFTVRAYLGEDATGEVVGAVSVTVEPATVAVDDASFVYDGAPKTLTPRFYPPEAGVGATITYSADGVALSDPPVAAGEYDVSVVAAEGYDGTASATLTITARPLNVTGVQWNDKSYDGTTVATAASAELAADDVVEGDDVELASPLAGAFAAASVGERAVTATFSLAGDDAGNYAIAAQPAGTATITAAIVDLTGVSALDKVYDGTTTATLSADPAAENAFGADVHLVATFAAAGAGEDTAVTVTLAGADAANFELATASLAASITRRPLQLTPHAITLAYGALLPSEPGFGADGLVAGEAISRVSVEVVGEATPPYPVGSYDLRVLDPVAAAGTALGNYLISTPVVNGGLTVAEAVVTVTPTGPFSKTYGSADPQFGYEVSGADLTDELTITRVAGENVGNYGFELGDVSAWPQYQFVLGASESFAITAASAVVTPAGGQSKTYGTTDPTFDFTVSGLVGDDSATGELVRAAGENVGGYQFDLGSVAISDGNGGANYVLSLPVDAPTFTVHPATLTVTPDPGQSKLIGAADPVFTYTASGLVNGDSASVLSGTLGREAGETAGYYDYTLGTLAVGPNYLLSLTGEATFAIGGVNVDDITVTYDGEPKSLVPSFAPAGAAVGATVSYFDAQGTQLAAAPVNAGVYSVTATAGPGFAGSDTATLTIQPRDLTVSQVAFADKVYDAGTGATLSAMLVTDDVVAGDDVRLVERLVGTFASSDVGEHGVVGNIDLAGLDAGNYRVYPQPAGTAAITQRPMSLLDFGVANKIYDGTTSVTEVYPGEVVGLVPADQYDSDRLGLEVEFTVPDAGAVVPVVFRLTGTSAANYALADPGVTATIYARDLTITVDDLTDKPYGTALELGVSASGFSTSGLAPGEAITGLTLASAGAAAAAPVADYPVNGSAPTGESFDAANYDISYVPGNVTVTPLPITISGTVTSWTYGDAPSEGDLAPIVSSGGLPAFASVGGELERTDVNVGSTASFAKGTFDIVDGEAISILSNFTVTYASYAITPRPLTITVSLSVDKTYGESLDLVADEEDFTVDGLAAGESVDDLTLSSDGSAENADVGGYGVAGSAPMGTDFDAGNYAISYVPGSLTVLPREVTLGGSFSVSEREYDGSTAAPVAQPHQLIIIDMLTGDDVTVAPVAAFADAGVGSGKVATLTAGTTLTGADAGNYNLSLVGAPTATGEVVKATVSFDVTIAGTGGLKYVTYDGGNTFQPSVTSSVEPVPAGQPIAFIVEIRYGGSNGPSRSSFRDVGLYTVTVTAADPRYQGSTTHPDLEVLKREVVLTSANTTKVYGAADPSLAPAISASSPNPLGSGDTFATETDLTYAGSVNQFQSVGEHAFSLGEVSIVRDGSDVTSNYDITFESGFTITPRDLTITPDADQAKTYGDADPTAFTYQATGFVGNDDESQLQGTLGRAMGEGAGLYGYQLGDLSAGGNYELQLVVEAPFFQIKRRAVTLSAATTSFTYGAVPSDLTALVQSGSLRDGDVLVGSLTTTGTTAGESQFAAAEGLAITRGGADVSANYTTTFGVYQVTPRAVEVVPDAGQSKTYGDDDGVLSYTLSGAVDSEGVSGALGRAAGEAVGSYAYTLGTLANPNYSLSLVTEAPSYTITPRAITLGVAVANKQYGDPDPSLAPVVTSGTVRAGDVLGGQLSYSGSDASATPYSLSAGTLQITRDGADVAGNYTISYGGFTIAPKPVWFDITNSDFTIGVEDEYTHVFQSDGVSEIRGLEVESAPADVNSFTFAYRRTHDVDYQPVPAGQQTVRDIDLLGSYVVTVTSTDPNYVGTSDIHVWVTDIVGVDFVTGDGYVQDGAEVPWGTFPNVAIHLVNAADEVRSAGRAGLTVALTTGGTAGFTVHGSSDSLVTSFFIEPGRDTSETAHLHLAGSGPAELTATPPGDFSPATMSFEVSGPG